MKFCNRVFSKLLHIKFIVIIILICLFLASCYFESSDTFPQISFPSENEVSQISDNISTPATVSSGVIKLAVPMSKECLQYLSLLYVGDTAGLFKETLAENNGLNIPLNALDNYNVGLTVELQSVASIGITNQELLLLNSSNNLPDIMLLNNLNQLTNTNFVPASFDSQLLDKYQKPGNVYAPMFQNSLIDNKIIALPLHSSLKMLYANNQLLKDSLNNSLLPIDNNFNLSSIINISKTITKPAFGAYGFMGLIDLLNYFPQTIDTTAKNFMWTGETFDFNNKAFIQSITEIKKLVLQGSAVDAITAEQKNTLYGSLDPRSINKIGFWIDDSNNLENWNLSGSKSVRRFLIKEKTNACIQLKPYYLVVNSNSKILNDSLRFAAFMSLDKNALLFRSRYTGNNGFIPPLSDLEVWENIVKPQLQGDELMEAFNYMYLSKIDAFINEEKVSVAYKTIYNKYFMDALYGKKNLSKQLDSIIKEANLLVAGE